MNWKTLPFLLLVNPLSVGWTSAADESPLVFLRNQHVEVGVWPEAGGRIVIFRRSSSENFLQSDPAKWGKTLEVTPQTPHQSLNGHEIWVSPQSDWWNQQELLPKRRQNNWPPDPFLAYSPVKVEKADEKTLLLFGQASPISGVRVDQQLQLHENGDLEMLVTLTNSSKTSRSWGIWSNTRVRPDAQAFVPMLESEYLKIEFSTRNPFCQDPLPHSLEGGYFSFLPSPAPGREQVSKAFLGSRSGVIAAFWNGEVFVKRAMDPVQVTHPSQEAIEIYGSYKPVEKSGDQNSRLLELEMHGPVVEIAPGESIRWRESWKLLPYAGSEDRAERIRFLSEIGVLAKEADK